ncbi:DNA-3-methyladenine glycosylase I [Phytoactinopolyspora limicola]|uniref:DNA-3-methyladenine glycosylase I n=1 Tax=Phytoactinopolyspora limicola TaxID=2715536 RepID=UPI00140E8F0C|nr:DNA-3-methyladenine glycosylase I [Phytoactinopolyspora limicola]
MPTDTVPDGAAPGPDGLLRCPWALSTSDYIEYHDDEWGRPVHGDAELYERLTLEGFQSGLSWLTILRKRAGFRRAFAGFDPTVVARFGDDDVTRLLTDAAIVRNRAKVNAAITNARALLGLREAEGDGALDRLVWSFAPDSADHPAPRSLADVPATTPESTALAKALKRRGFVFVGPTTAYATMQATGVVNDHLAGCVARTT